MTTTTWTATTSPMQCGSNVAAARSSRQCQTFTCGSKLCLILTDAITDKIEAEDSRYLKWESSAFYSCYCCGTFSIRSSILQCRTRAKRIRVSPCALLMSFRRCSYCRIVRKVIFPTQIPCPTANKLHTKSASQYCNVTQFKILRKFAFPKLFLYLWQ